MGIKKQRVVGAIRETTTRSVLRDFDDISDEVRRDFIYPTPRIACRNVVVVVVVAVLSLDRFG